MTEPTERTMSESQRLVQHCESRHPEEDYRTEERIYDIIMMVLFREREHYLAACAGTRTTPEHIAAALIADEINILLEEEESNDEDN